MSPRLEGPRTLVLGIGGVSALLSLVSWSVFGVTILGTATMMGAIVCLLAAYDHGDTRL